MADEVKDEVKQEAEADPAAALGPEQGMVPAPQQHLPFGELRSLKAATEQDHLAIEAAVMGNDYSKLSVAQRLMLVQRKCAEEGISILQQPYAWGTMNSKLTLISQKGRAHQLRAIHNISVAVKQQTLDKDAGIFLVHVMAVQKDTSGHIIREDEDLGIVPILDADGALLNRADLSNKMMAAITKAKNRVTYSICGVGGLDETEVADVRTPSTTGVREPGPRVIDPTVGRFEKVMPPPTPPPPQTLPTSPDSAAEFQQQQTSPVRPPVPPPQAPTIVAPTQTKTEAPPPPKPPSPAPQAARAAVPRVPRAR